MTSLSSPATTISPAEERKDVEKGGGESAPAIATLEAAVKVKNRWCAD